MLRKIYPKFIDFNPIDIITNNTRYDIIINNTTTNDYLNNTYRFTNNNVMAMPIIYPDNINIPFGRHSLEDLKKIRANIHKKLYDLWSKDYLELRTRYQLIINTGAYTINNSQDIHIWTLIDNTTGEVLDPDHPATVELRIMRQTIATTIEQSIALISVGLTLDTYLIENNVRLANNLFNIMQGRIGSGLMEIFGLELDILVFGDSDSYIREEIIPKYFD